MTTITAPAFISTDDTSTDEYGREAVGWFCEVCEEGHLSVEPEDSAETLHAHLRAEHPPEVCRNCGATVFEHPDEGNGPYWVPEDWEPCADENGLPAPHSPGVTA